MREERRDDLVPFFLLAFVAPVCSDDRGQGKDSVGSAAGLDAEHIEPGNCLKKLSHFVHYLKHTLCRICRLKGMHVEHLGRSGKAFVYLRAVLHRTCALAYVYVAVNP
ncbi:hypothetical protein SDC9_195049 [bioreactor metagenome]|uniref:Uncharacterized protein n=1 Tax=bioreactor metagenome TaxID=1076179 RepID=A0A645I7X0_9ZZZZ